MINILEMESSKGWGGQEKRTVRLVNHLDKSKYRVFWAVEYDSNLLKKQHKINAKFFPVKLSRIYNLRTIFILCRFVRNNDIRIISTHSGKDSWIGNIVGIITNTKVVRVRHLILPIKKPTSYNLATKVITVSKQVKSYLRSKGVKKDKLINIYTGIDTDKFIDQQVYDLRKELNLDKDIKLVGVVAVLRGAKRHKELIETFLQLKDVDARLIIVGDGPQMQNLVQLVKSINSKNIILLGHREDVDRLLPNFDIFCLPSRHEALGTSLLEAQSCGVPVIASNVGGIPEALIDKETGYLFDDFNVLQKQLTELLNNDSKLNYLKGNTRKFIVDNFSVDRMVEDTQILYDDLTQSS